MSNTFVTPGRSKVFITPDATSISVVDSALSTTSKNPVQNKVITEKINSIEADGATDIAMTIDSQYILTTSLLNTEGTVISSDSIDLPLESMVVGGSYANKVLTLTLKNGQTINIPIGDMVSGLVPDTRTVNGQPLSSDVLIEIPVVDTELDIGSENAIENKAVALALNTKITTPAAPVIGQFLKYTANGWVTDEAGSSITVDSALSTTSENPVQNKVITNTINPIINKVNGIDPGAQVNKIETITLNGTAFSINTSTKTASGSVTTCSPFPAGTVKNGTTIQLCNSLVATGEAKIGMMFMETITLSDSPSGGRAEVLVRVMGTSTGDEVLYLEMHSTNTAERNWYTMWYNGAMEWGDTDCPWFASLILPKSSYDPSKRCGDLLTKEYTAASQKYVDDKMSDVSTYRDQAQAAAQQSQQYYNQLIEVYQPDTLGPCTDMGIIRSTDSNKFTWYDPDNVVVANTVRAKFVKSELWRIESSTEWPEYPGCPGSVLIGKTEVGTAHPKNAYSTTPLVDDTIEEGHVYSYALFSYSTNGAITKYTANQYPISTNLSWSMIAQLSRDNTLLNYMSIGQIVTYHHDYFVTPEGSHEIPVRLVSVDGCHATDRNLYPHCSVWETVDCLYRADTPAMGTVQWDASEAQYALTADTTYLSGKQYYSREGSTYTLMVEGTDYQVGDPIPDTTVYEKNPNPNYGNGTNLNGQDNLGQYLNADALSGWETKLNLWDNMSTSFSGRPGFMYGLDIALKNVLVPCVRLTAKATPYGGGSLICTKKVFLPTLYEKFGQTNNIIEGYAQWEYYVGTTASYKVKLLNNVASYHWLESPIVSLGDRVFSVTPSGASGSINANNSYGVAPCFLIGAPDESYNQQS